MKIRSFSVKYLSYNVFFFIFRIWTFFFSEWRTIRVFMVYSLQSIGLRQRQRGLEIITVVIFYYILKPLQSTTDIAFPKPLNSFRRNVKIYVNIFKYLYLSRATVCFCQIFSFLWSSKKTCYIYINAPSNFNQLLVGLDLVLQRSVRLKRTTRSDI